MSPLTQGLRYRAACDENLTFSDQISSLSKSCYSHICELRCIRPYLGSKTASTIAVSIVHSKLGRYKMPEIQHACMCIFLSQLSAGPILLRVHRSKRVYRTTQAWLNLTTVTLSTRLQSSSDLCTGSQLMNALNINSCHSPTKFLQPANLTTYTILSLFSLQVELASHLLSSQLDHPYLSHYKSTTLSHMHHLTCGISSLLIHSISFCSLSSWFTSSCTCHLITVTIFALITYHCLYLHSRLKTHLFHKSFPP